MYFSHLIFALVFYLSAVDGKAVGTSDYVYYKEAGGKLKLHHNPASWRKARLTCYNEGALLASPENDDLLAAMTFIIKSNFHLPSSEVFTGVHDIFSKGIFVSLKGTSLEYDMPVTWAPGEEPDSSNEETCVSMRHNGWLVSSKCTDERPFICYKVVPPALPKPSCGPADNGYTFDVSTSSCYKFHKEYKYWKDAFATCYNERAHLAVLNSKNEAIVLKNLYQANEAGREDGPNIAKDIAHIGFVDWGREGGLWMTIHGQPLDMQYANWNSGEPNNGTSQFCGGLYRDGYLDDVNCYDGDPNHFKRSFICEKEPTFIEDKSSVNID